MFETTLLNQCCNSQSDASEADQFLHAVFQEIPSFFPVGRPSKPLAATQALKVAFPLRNRGVLRSRWGEGKNEDKRARKRWSGRVYVGSWLRRLSVQALRLMLRSVADIALDLYTPAFFAHTLIPMFLGTARNLTAYLVERKAPGLDRKLDNQTRPARGSDPPQGDETLVPSRVNRPLPEGERTALSTVEHAFHCNIYPYGLNCHVSRLAQSSYYISQHVGPQLARFMKRFFLFLSLSLSAVQPSTPT